MMIVRTFVVASILFKMVYAEAMAPESMTGTWRAIWSCNKVTEPFEPRCVEGAHDSFTLKILVKDAALCGLHAATAQMGNRIDEAEGPQPSIIGERTGTSAKVTFVSSWGDVKGTASLTLKGKSLEWKILSEEEGGQHWLPRKATLHRIPNLKWGSELKCP